MHLYQENIKQITILKAGKFPAPITKPKKATNNILMN